MEDARYTLALLNCDTARACNMNLLIVPLRILNIVHSIFCREALAVDLLLYLLMD